MATFGAIFRASDGSLLVTSETPCYELVATKNPNSRVGNVSTYTSDVGRFPLVFVNCGVGNSAGVLSVVGEPGDWTITVLATNNCPINIFIPLTAASTSGYGVSVFDSAGNPVFDSAKDVLNARVIGLLSESAASFYSASGTDMVAYTSGPVFPQKTDSVATVLADVLPVEGAEFVCSNNLEYVCEYQWFFRYETRCGYEDVCTFVGFQTVCSTQYVCRQVPVYGYEQVCTYRYVQRCDYVTYFGNIYIYATIKTTSWEVSRGVARINADASVFFDWLLHESGVYRDVLSYESITIINALSSTAAGLPFGFTPPGSFFIEFAGYEGRFTSENTFPYTTDRANIGVLPCITAVRSDYE